MKIASAVLALSLSACAGAPVTRQPVAYDFPTCSGSTCEVKWSRALQWIQANSSFGVHIISDQLIETFPSVGVQNSSAAYRVTKAALGNGQYRLVIEANCGNLFGCGPSDNPQIRIPAMIRFIETGQK